MLPNLSVVLTSLSATGAWYRSLLPRELTLSHYVAALQDDLVMPSFDGTTLQLGAVGNSIVYAGVATLLGVVIAVGVALVVVRSSVPFRGALDVLSMLPLAVPGLVMAFGYLSISVQFTRALGVWAMALLTLTLLLAGSLLGKRLGAMFRT